MSWYAIQVEFFQSILCASFSCTFAGFGSPERLGDGRGAQVASPQIGPASWTAGTQPAGAVGVGENFPHSADSCCILGQQGFQFGLGRFGPGLPFWGSESSVPRHTLLREDEAPAEP